MLQSSELAGSGFATQVESEDEFVQPKHELATSAHVRKILFASASRDRNLCMIAMTSASAMVMLGLGMTWSGLTVFGLGTLLYALLIAKDALSEKFLSQLFSVGNGTILESTALPEESEIELDVAELEEKMRAAYLGVLRRRTQLRRRLEAGPALLRESLPDGLRFCDTLLGHAKRLVLRGQRLHEYLASTALDELSESVSSIELQGESSKDLVAARIFRQVVSGRQRHIETHIEVEGLYERVLAQLMLIETTLGGAIAQIVKITANDDEGSSLTASRVSEELETLVSRVRVLESSLDEVLGDAHAYLGLEHAAPAL